MLPYHRQVVRQFTYKVVTPPVGELIPLEVVKEHLKLDPNDNSQDGYLTLLVKAVFNYAEEYTGRTFLTTIFETYRDNFTQCSFALRRSPLQAVNSIQYYQDRVLVTLPANAYYYTIENDYSKIYEASSIDYWPRDIDQRRQAIVINFTVGFGDSYTDIPSDLVMAILNHIAKVYESRGDCDDASGDCGCSSALPSVSKMVYNMHRIQNITGETYTGR